jgi:hypothetical protein
VRPCVARRVEARALAEHLARLRRDPRRDARAGLDVEIQEFAGHWAVKFFMSSQSHTAPGGTGWARTPWAAVQEAAWQTLTTENPAARLEAQLARSDGTSRPNPAGGPAAQLRR